MELFVSSKIKAHSLTGRITPELVRSAFKAVKRNRGAAGIDKVSIQMFAANLDANLDSILRDLKDGSFKPMPSRRQFSSQTRIPHIPARLPHVRHRQENALLSFHLETGPLANPAIFGRTSSASP